MNASRRLHDSSFKMHLPTADTLHQNAQELLQSLFDYNNEPLLKKMIISSFWRFDSRNFTQNNFVNKKMIYIFVADLQYFFR